MNRWGVHDYEIKSRGLYEASGRNLQDENNILSISNDWIIPHKRSFMMARYPGYDGTSGMGPPKDRKGDWERCATRERERGKKHE